MHLITLLVVIVLVLVAVELQQVWLALLLVVLVIIWMLSRAGGEVASAGRYAGSGLKADAKREYADLEKTETKTPDMKVADELVKKLARKTGEFKYFPSTGLEPQGGTSETFEISKSSGGLFGKFAKDLIRFWERIFKK